jgi:hypothetical protein
MCDKPSNLIRETKWIGYFIKDNALDYDRDDPFVLYLRPCLCGKSVVGRVPGGHIWAEVEGVMNP